MENKKPQNPLPAQAFEVLAGWAKGHVVSALSSLGVFEHIGTGSVPVSDLAARCSLHQDMLYRTLRFSAKAGIVNLEGEQVSLTDLGKLFLKDTPGSMAISVQFFNAPPWRDSWQNFSHCLQTGKPAFNHVFGRPFFDYLDEHQEYGKQFNEMGTTRTTMMAPFFLEAYDFSDFQTICDVGGGQGIFLKFILEEYPHSSGILFDLESAMGGNLLAGMEDRVAKVPGSFFERIPSADCLVLKSIIHDWSDEDSLRILKNCRKALNEGGKVLVIEHVLTEPFDQVMLFYDLHMQVMIGGAERTEAEFRNLLEAAGLKLNRIVPTRMPFSIIEAV